MPLTKIKKIPKIKPLKEVEREFRERIITFILGGFGLVAALAWNDAIQSFFNDIFPKGHSSIIGKFFYALLVTVIVVIVSLQLRKIFEKKE